jgi:hypothetical protein
MLCDDCVERREDEDKGPLVEPTGFEFGVELRAGEPVIVAMTELGITDPQLGQDRLSSASSAEQDGHRMKDPLNK